MILYDTHGNGAHNGSRQVFIKRNATWTRWMDASWVLFFQTKQIVQFLHLW